MPSRVNLINNIIKRNIQSEMYLEIHHDNSMNMTYFLNIPGGIRCDISQDEFKKLASELDTYTTHEIKRVINDSSYNIDEQDEDED